MRMTIRKKVGIGVGALALLLPTVTLSSFLAMRHVSDIVAQIVERRNPQTTAAYEMEINLYEISSAVLGYLHDRDPGHLDRLRQDEAHLETFQATYMRHSDAGPEEDIGRTTGQEFRGYQALAWGLVKDSDDLVARMHALTQQIHTLDGILDDRIQALIPHDDPQRSEKARAAMEMEINANGMAKYLAMFLMTGDIRFANGVRDDADDFGRALEEYRRLDLSLEDREWTDRLAGLFASSAKAVGHIIEVNDRQATRLNEFVRLRQSLDDLLDDRLQASVRDRLVDATRHAAATVDSARKGMLLATVLSVVAGLGAWLFLSATVVRPVRQLVSAMDSVAAGDYSKEVPLSSRDELGDLTVSFNTMVAERKRAWDAEKAIHSELEHRIADRTAELVESNERLMAEIAEHARAEQSLGASELTFRTLAEYSSVGIFLDDRHGACTYVNPKCAELVGLSREECLNRSWVPSIHPDDVERVTREWNLAVQQGSVFDQEYRWVHRDGRVVPTHGIVAPARVSADTDVQVFVGTLVDLTERELADKKRIQLEDQLQQVQKLESIGRLAGGVAHDFNNILSVVLGYAEIVLAEVSPEHPFHEPMQEIYKAGVRARDLTRQLLAFSRKQIVQMRVLDLNVTLHNLEKMLRRLVGEDIVLAMFLAPDLGRVEGDLGQIEQVIMNLVVNARDAMPEGGKLTIETTNATLDEAYAQEHIGVVPGPHVMVAVSDTGEGMTEETRSKIFEPFFTTKEMGRGTGLGLSTVYGIVKQSGGSIWCYSEPGGGTCFKIYLPRTDADHVPAMPGTSGRDGVADGLQVLVVEDDAALRSVMGAMLTSLGCRATIVSSGEESLHAVRVDGLRPDVVITDVVMPGMGGRVVADRLREVLPDVKVLFMSGYTDNVILHHGVLDPEVHFLQKPFSIDDLASRIKETLA